ncbi:MAG: peroxiredoxin family protein [Gammaproteobacteria bacterium]
MKIKEWLIGLFLVGLIAASALVWLKSGSAPAPETTFTTITGKKIVLEELRGKPVIVTFWATDCPGCIKEIPHLIDLYRQYHDKGLEIVATAMFYDPPSHVVSMTEAKQLPYDVALDVDGRHSKAFGEVRLTPTTFLISPGGDIVMHKIGVFDVADMKNRIETLLKG